MNKRIQYEVFINDIKKSNETDYVLDQKKARKLVNNELPKSLFSRNYLLSGRNKLSRFIIENNLSFDIIEPEIIIHKN